jgi:lysophospholipase L1-like esterase
MKIIAFLFIFFSCFPGIFAQKISITEPVRLLALGDSYTIGQSVGINERWPAQLAIALGKKGYNVAEVRYIAQTGWRTDDLAKAISSQQPLTGYNLVSLLIGVNNQYQGGSIQTYTPQFDDLLRTAISLAGNIPEHVFVLSIPDYAYTPFGKGNMNISNQIDQFNVVNRMITGNFQVTYIDITPISRLGLAQPYLVASDGLHPSGAMYALWVDEIMKNVENQLGVEKVLNKSEFGYSLSQKLLTVTFPPKATDIRIFNASGQMVINKLTSVENECSINMGNLPSGMYFLVLRSGGRLIYRAKMILN